MLSTYESARRHTLDGCREGQIKSQDLFSLCPNKRTVSNGSSAVWTHNDVGGLGASHVSDEEREGGPTAGKRWLLKTVLIAMIYGRMGGGKMPVGWCGMFIESGLFLQNCIGEHSVLPDSSDGDGEEIVLQEKNIKAEARGGGRKDGTARWGTTVLRGNLQERINRRHCGCGIISDTVTYWLGVFLQTWMQRKGKVESSLSYSQTEDAKEKLRLKKETDLLDLGYYSW